MKFLVSLICVVSFALANQAFAAPKTVETARRNATEISKGLKLASGVAFEKIIELAEVSAGKTDNAFVALLEKTVSTLKSNVVSQNLKNHKAKLEPMVRTVDEILGLATIYNRNGRVQKSLIPNTLSDGQKLLDAMEGSVGALAEILSAKDINSVNVEKATKVMEILSRIREEDIINGNKDLIKELEEALGVDLETFIKNCRK